MGLWRQYNLVVDTFERKRRNIHLSTEHERTPPSKIKKKDKNKCSFSSSLFCSRLPTYISCWVGSDDDDDARMHEYHYKAKIARNSRQTGCALTNTSAEKTSKKLVFFLLRRWTATLCISPLFFLPNRGDHYRRELSTAATGRPVSYATRDEFRNTFQMLKFMAFDPLRYFVSLFCSSLSPSLFCFGYHSLSHSMVDLFPCHLLTIPIRRIRSKGVSGGGVSLRFSFVPCLNFFASALIEKPFCRKKNRNRNNRWSKFFFFYNSER